jgi:exodeoxyribonuclease-5
MATQARLEGRIRSGDYGDGCKKVPMHQRFRIPMKPADGDLVIVGYNRTRNELNDYYRRKNGYAGLPKTGDTVICLRNNYEAGVFNGLRGTVVSYEPTADERYSAAFAEIRMMDDDYVFSGEVAGEQFGKPKTMQEIPRSLGLFDFGYAMTCHKAQGSQADRVMVVEERMPRATDELHARWLYTAVTRAAKEVIVVGH